MPRPMPKADVAAFYDRLRTIDPEPKGELDYVNPYTLLVAVALSAQSTDVGVNKATKDLFTTVDHPAKMLALGEDGLKQHIKTIGLYNTKAKNVIALSQMLMDEHGGEVPDDQAALERLPGVGRKTANVVRNIAFGAPTMAVDTHIFRIGNRTGTGAGQNRSGSRKRPAEAHADGVHAPRASLAHPARPLYLQSAKARMLALPGGGPMPPHGQGCEPEP